MYADARSKIVYVFPARDSGCKIYQVNL